MDSHLVAPHGGTLVEFAVDQKKVQQLKEESRNWVSWNLTPRQFCDLELIINGGFSPLTSFLGRRDYEGVCQKMRLADGTIWPIPVMLDISEETAKQLKTGSTLALRDFEGVMLAAIHV